MGKSFRQCDNLNEKFILIQNIMLQTNLPQINYNTPVNNPNNLNSQEAPTLNSNIMMPKNKYSKIKNIALDNSDYNTYVNNYNMSGQSNKDYDYGLENYYIKEN